MCEILKNFTFYLCAPSQEMTGGCGTTKMRQQIRNKRRHVILETGYSTEVRSEENSHDNDERKSQGDITWLQAFQSNQSALGQEDRGPRRDVSKKSGRN